MALAVASGEGFDQRRARLPRSSFQERLHVGLPALPQLAGARKCVWLEVVEGTAQGVRVARQLERLGQAPANRPPDAALGDEAVERRPGAGRRPELGDRPIAVRHKQALAALHAAQVAAEVLAQLGDADRVRHVHKGSRYRSEG